MAGSSLKSVFTIIVACLFVLPGCGSSNQVQTPSGQSSVPNQTGSNPLTVLSISEGSVQVMKSGSGNWASLPVGTVLQNGDTIRTGDASRALITFFDGTTIELKAGTQVEIASLIVGSQSGSTTIQLKQQIGETISTVTKLIDPASRYEIETPAAVAAVRGSAMRVVVDSSGRTTVTNIEGTISVVAQGIEVSIPIGMSSVVNKGEPPGQPQPTTTTPPTFTPPPTSTPPPATSPPGTSSQIPGGIEFTVSAKAGWQQTPVTLKYGEEFYMYFISGGWSVDSRNYANVGPGGYDPVTDAKVAGGYSGFKVDPSVPYGCLLGRVGNGSTIALGDKWGPFAEGQSGIIHLRINDADQALVDNDGTITVVILTYVPPPFHVSAKADRSSVFEGDIITYTYEVWNRVDVPAVTNLTVKDAWSNLAILKSGDTNSNGVLDMGEKWVYTSTYATRHADIGKITNKATANGRYSSTTSASVFATAEVTVNQVRIEFTEPGPGSIITGPAITVVGVVNDPSITQVVITHNGQSIGSFGVTGGRFSAPLTLVNGLNTIEATIVKPGSGTISARMIIDFLVGPA